MHGFQFKVIDRFMHSSRAGWGGAIIGTTVFTMLVGAARYNMATGNPYLSWSTTAAIAYAVGAVGFALLGWYCVLTWRRLWRCGRGHWEVMVFDFGVRTFGPTLLLVWALTATFFGHDVDGSWPFGPMSIAALCAALLVGLVPALHLGQLWGTLFALVRGIERDPRVESGEAPRLVHGKS